MINFKDIGGIRKDAIRSIKSNSNNDLETNIWKRISFFILFIIAPLLISFLSWCLNLKLSSIDSFIGTTIAVFTGLFFSLLLAIGSKVKTEKNNPNMEENNFHKFKNNMKQIASIILYVVTLGIIIFSLTLINSFLINIDKICFERYITAIVMFFMTRFIVAILAMLQRFKYVVYDEINNIL